MTNLMNEQEFTQLYIDALRETFPDITINSTVALEVSTITPDDQREVKHFLDKKLDHYNIVYYHLDSKFVDKYTL